MMHVYCVWSLHSDVTVTPNVVILRFNGHFPGEPGLAGVY